MGLASLILSIIGIMCCISIIFAPIGVVLTLIGLILGIVDTVKKGKTGEKRGVSVTGLVLNAVFLVILFVESLIVIIGFGLAIFNKTVDTTDSGMTNRIYSNSYDYDEDIISNRISSNIGNILASGNTLDQLQSKGEISGNRFIGKYEDSLLDLKRDGTFLYYRDKDDLTDNYYEGTYEVYQGEDAVEYITTELVSYGVTEQELRAFFTRNTGEMSVDNFYCLVLNNQTCIINGENTIDTPVATPYYGFYLEDQNLFRIVNMNTASYVYFEKDV